MGPIVTKLRCASVEGSAGGNGGYKTDSAAIKTISNETVLDAAGNLGKEFPLRDSKRFIPCVPDVLSFCSLVIP